MMNSVSVRLTYSDGDMVYVGLGTANNTLTAIDIALKDLRERIPRGHKRPIVRVRREGDDLAKPWELWVPV